MTDEIRWLLLCAALALGEAAGFAVARFAALWPVVLAFVAVLALIGYARRWRGGLFVVTFGLGFVLSLRFAAARQAVLDEVLVMGSGRPYEAVFEVEGPVSLRQSAENTTWASFYSTLGPVNVRVICPCPAGETPQVGTWWRCAGWLARRPEGHGRRYAFWVCGKGSFAARVAAAPAAPSAFRRRLKDELSARLGLGLPGGERIADLHRAILLGERERLDRTSKDDFIAAGTIHVFAISGLHVVVVAKVLALLLAFTRFPMRMSGLVLIPALWAYVFLVGCPPSAIRAAAMLSLGYVAPLFWRRPNGVTAWALTFLGVYALMPACLHDVGCWMSFAVMLMLVIWGRWGIATKSRLLDFILFTWVAWMASLPIAAHVFGRITPGGLMANLLVAPLATGSVVGSLGGALSSFVSEGLAGIFNNLTAVCTEVMVDLSRAVAAVPGASVTIESWSLGGCLVWYALMLSGLVVLRRNAARPPLGRSADRREARNGIMGRMRVKFVCGVMLALLLRGARAAEVWYIPGWMRTADEDGRAYASCTNVYADTTCRFRGWDGDCNWWSAVEHADQAARQLAEEIAATNVAFRAGLTLVGHSLGGRIIAHTLARLQEKGIRIHQGVLLAPAIPMRDPDVQKMGGGSVRPVIVVVNPQDTVLKYVFTISGQESPSLGTDGTFRPVTNVVEYAVPSTVTEMTTIDACWGKSESLKRLCNHLAPFYFTELEKIRAGTPSTNVQLRVVQDKINLEWKTIDAGVWWDVMDSRQGWKIERHIVTCHCRILDPEGRRVAWGNERDMRLSFAKIKAQLKGNEE
ncbi:MAG: ComEC/Rec2 family competence protein [Kiritimatiellia bacterium]